MLELEVYFVSHWKAIKVCFRWKLKLWSRAWKLERKLKKFEEVERLKLKLRSLGWGLKPRSQEAEAQRSWGWSAKPEYRGAEAEESRSWDWAWTRTIFQALSAVKRQLCRYLAGLFTLRLECAYKHLKLRPGAVSSEIIKSW